MSSIPLQQIDWDLISNLYGSYEKSRRAREQEEQEKALRYQQMQLVQMQLAEKKREEEYQTSMLPYLQQEESRIRETAAGVQPPPLTPVGPQGLPPEEPGGYRDVGAALKPMPGSPGLSPWFQQPPPEQQFEYEKAQLEGVPNKYEILSRHAMKYGRPKEALAYEEMATPQKIQKINALLQMAIKNNDEGMYRTLLNERRMLEDQIAISEKKYTERDIEGVKTELAMGQKDVKGRVSVPELGGTKLLYSINKYGKGEVQLPNGKWQEYTPQGEIEPLIEKEGSLDIQWLHELMSKGMSRADAITHIQKEKQARAIEVAEIRVPGIQETRQLPFPFFLDRRRGLAMQTPEGRMIPIPPHLHGDVPLLAANWQANMGNLKNLEKQEGMVLQAVETAQLNGDQLMATSNQYKRFNYPAPNKFLQWAQRNLGDQQSQAELATFKLALLAFSREYMRVVTGAARSVAELSITAQTTADEVMDRFSSWEVLDAKIIQARKEMAMQKNGYIKTIHDVKKEINAQPYLKFMGTMPKPLVDPEYDMTGVPQTGTPPPRSMFTHPGHTIEGTKSGTRWQLQEDGVTIKRIK